MAVSKRLRFEILRRDNHACRYCGGAAPEVKLVVDHVVPVTLGGSDESTNLVTACQDCNSGKSASAPDSSIVADVNAQSLLWSAAIAEAARRREREFQEFDELMRSLFERWQSARPHQFASADMPGDADSSIRQFIAAGLTTADLHDLIDVALYSRASNKWKYFCGCAWSRVKQAQEQAAAIIEEWGPGNAT